MTPAEPTRVRLSLSVAIFLNTVTHQSGAAFETANDACRDAIFELDREENAFDNEKKLAASDAIKALADYMKEMAGPDDQEEEEEGEEVEKEGTRL